MSPSADYGWFPGGNAVTSLNWWEDGASRDVMMSRGTTSTAAAAEKDSLTMNTTPRIAIIGAGPGGLTLASVLQVNGIDTVVYEREAADAAACQGGTLELHPECGQHALREAGRLGSSPSTRCGPTRGSWPPRSGSCPA
ncbi:FAD-dependent monooxygenase [Streptomyces violaceusniger]